MNKKGISAVGLLEVPFYMLFVAIFLGVVVLIFTLTSEGLNQDVVVGDNTLGGINNLTFNQISSGLESNADLIGMALLLGMSISLLFSAYFFGSSNHRLFLIVDIFIIIFSVVLTVYLAQSYETFISAYTGLENIYINDLADASKFVLNLPAIVGTLGALIMILSYSGLKRRNEKEDQVLGF